MFTGIVRECGRVVGQPVGTAGGGLRLRLAHSKKLSDQLELGSSLAVSGVCLTLVDMAPGWSDVELSPETLARTTLDQLVDGSEVNLEPALCVGEALGGHWVQGHVDGVVEITECREFGQHREFIVELPDQHRPHVVEKGSVTLDGISLTISALSATTFEVALIPHTLEVTTSGRWKAGTRMNLEVDILAKYVQRALATAGRLS